MLKRGKMDRDQAEFVVIDQLGAEGEFTAKDRRSGRLHAAV